MYKELTLLTFCFIIKELHLTFSKIRQSRIFTQHFVFVMDNLKVEGGNALISKLIGWVFQDARLAHDVKTE